MSSWRPVLVALVLVAGGVVLFTQGLTSPAGVRRAVESAGVAAPVVFVAVYAALTVLLVPGSIGSAAAGALFGAAWGTSLVVLGATLGATAAFLLARSVGRARIERLTGSRVGQVDRWLTDHGLGAVLFLRLVPLFPFNAVNYGAGLSGLRVRTYVTGTALGIVPGTVAWVGLGAGLGDPGSPAFLASLALLVALTLGGVLVLRLTGRRESGAFGGEDSVR